MNRPILFSGPMVKAILAGSKTMTRRLPNARVRQKWNDYAAWVKAGETGEAPPVRTPLNERDFYAQYPPYHVGDILWVRETYAWATGDYAGGGYGLFDTYVYKADGKSQNGWPVERMIVSSWRPSIHMPCEAARIFLRVTDVRLERLCEIDAHGAKAEGVEPIDTGIEWKGISPPDAYIRAFAELWDSLRKPAELSKCGFEADPWVWVISFERCEKPEGFLP